MHRERSDVPEQKPAPASADIKRLTSQPFPVQVLIWSLYNAVSSLSAINWRSQVF